MILCTQENYSMSPIQHFSQPEEVIQLRCRSILWIIFIYHDISRSSAQGIRGNKQITAGRISVE